MSLLHPALLGLLALAAVPVILHFLMRPKPKRLVFPALRLIEPRRRTNVRRLRLRHVWLLLLRVLVIALLVFAAARPLVPAANYGLDTSELVTLAAVAAACLLGYAAAVRWWGRRSAARHEFLYRRTLLRGGTGAVAALLVLLLVAWPYARRVSAEVSDPNANVAEDRPVAAVFLFDTSLSMDYQFEGRTRLDAGRRVALEHVANLPSGSRVAVTTSAADDAVIFQADLPGATKRVEAVETRPTHVPLDVRLRAALDLQRQDRTGALGEQAAIPEQLRRDPFVRAVYVFTDLTRPGWSGVVSKSLKDRLAEDKWLQLYLVDVGVKEPIDVAITAARPSDEVVTADSRISIRADLAATGGGRKDVTVELYVDGDGGPVKQGQSVVTVDGSQGGRVEFPLAVVKPPFARGELRLATADPLPADDVRYFTVAVEPPPKVLLVADRPADLFLWGEALAASRYEVTRIASDRLAAADLAKFDVVYLFNVESPAEAAWAKLAAHVRGGGGLGVVLGRRVESFVYNSEAAQAILPARLRTSLAFDPPELLSSVDESHPLFERFDQLGGFADLTRRAVRRHWSVELTEGSAVLATYTFPREPRPAVLARAVAEGRVVMFTTGLDEGGWSELPLAGWPFVALADQTTRYLAGRAGGRRNYEAGEAVNVDLGRGATPKRLILRRPNLEQAPVPVPEGDRRLSLRDLEQVGHYDVTAASGEPAFAGGFSLNVPATESDLTRMTSDDLNERLGEGRYRVATNPKNLAVAVRDTTLGAELMPYLFVLLVAVFCGEHFVANRFYDSEQTPEHK